jgi:membrane-associated phospholipid phosphatase
MFSFELKIIEYIQKFRTPLLDEFFKFVNYFDTDFFYFLLIPVIWIGYNRKLGVKLYFILMISALVNDQLKNIFMVPRPSQIDPSLGLIQLSSYSFPSGAAQSAVLIPLIFINHFKEKKWPIFVGICYFLIISFSRMYLGVHFLSDILAGWIIGFLLFLLYLYVFPKVESHVIKRPIFSFWVYQGTLLILLLLPGTIRIVISILGVFLGLFLSYEFNMFLDNSKNFKDFLIRSLLAILGVFSLYFLYYFLHKKILFINNNIITYLMSFWISFLCSFFYKKLFLRSYTSSKK